MLRLANGILNQHRRTGCVTPNLRYASFCYPSSVCCSLVIPSSARTALWSTFLWEGEEGKRITRLTDIAKIASFVQYHVRSRVLNFERPNVTIVVFYVVVFLMSISLFIDNINRKIVNKHIKIIMNLIWEKNLYIYIYARKKRFCWSTENNFVWIIKIIM